MKTFKYEDRDQVYRAFGISVPADVTDLDAILDAKPSGKVTPLISNLIHLEEINIIFGVEKIGKSWFADALTYSISRGYDLDPYHTLKAPKSVMMVTGEMTISQQAKQDSVSERIYPYRENSITFLKCLQFPQKLDDRDGQKLLLQLIERENTRNKDKEKISVLLLDNLKNLTKAGEQVAGWRSFFGFLNELRLKEHLTIIVIHHPVKDGTMGGTSDLNIKIDTTWECTRDTDQVSPFDAQDCLNVGKEYNCFIKDRITEWRCSHPDDVYFFLINHAGRTLASSEKRTVLLHMNPDVEMPQWGVVDFLSDRHPWSYTTFRKGQTNKDNVLVSTSQDTSEAYEDKRPTYEQLRKNTDRSLMVNLIRKAVANGCKTRQEIGAYFNTDKNGIDYLCQKFKPTITEVDYMPQNKARE